MKLQELKNIIKNEIRLALAEGDTETKPAPVKPATPTKQPNHPLRPKNPNTIPKPGKKPGERPAKAQTPQKEGMSKGIEKIVDKYNKLRNK